ncbi:MAG: PepSY-associated TM helix domain-containing protein [Bacteroidota bacterium]
MNLKKLIRKVHLWLGLTSGLVVFVLGTTGCLWVFQEELWPIVHNDLLLVKEPASGNPLPISQNLQAAQQAVGSEIPLNQVTVINQKNRSYQLSNRTHIEQPDAIWYWEEIERNLWVYVNPYTSEILGIQDETLHFFEVIRFLHMSLLLRYEMGHKITGWATLIFIIMLTTGLVLWWPRNNKAFKVRTWFRWKSDTKWKRKNYDLHNIIGFYSMFLVIFIALTGLMWAFSWFSDGVEWIANGGKTIKEEAINVESTITQHNSTHPLDMVHHSLKTDHSEAKVYYINLPQDSAGTIGTYVAYEDRTKNVYLQFDRYSGALLHTGDKWEDKTNGEKVWAYNFDIHTGAIGGIVGKTIAFFLSLFSASLPVTGFIIWFGRNKKKRRLKRTGGTGGAKKVVEAKEGEKLKMNRIAGPPKPTLKPVIKKSEQGRLPVIPVQDKRG